LLTRSDGFFSNEGGVAPMTVTAQVRPATMSSSKPSDSAKKGLFVVFEGVDGTGKSTVSRMVYEQLEAEYPGRVELTAEPTDSWLGECVRRSSAEEVTGAVEALLFVADRAEHTRQIRAWLNEGKIVLCDRYYFSTIAYQGAALKASMGAKAAIEWLKEINRPVIERPDLTLLLAMRVDAALERLSSRGGKTKFEQLDYLRDVDGIYRALAMEEPKLHTIDASRTSVEVAKDAIRLIKNNI